MIITEATRNEAAIEIEEDFVLYQINDLWHWESKGNRFGDDYCSEDGFEKREDCVADAIDYLSRIHSVDSDNGGNDEPSPTVTLSDIEAVIFVSELSCSCSKMCMAFS